MSAKPTGLADALAFLRQWYGDQAWSLCSIHPDKLKDADGRILRHHDGTDAANWLAAQGGRNIYFHCNVADPKRKDKAEKQHIRSVICLHVDLDPPDPPPGTTDHAAYYEREKEKLLMALREYDPPPSIIIDSGGGVQGFWLLEQPYDIDKDETKANEDIEFVEARNRYIEKTLGGDHCHDISRIMRVPGTTNWPSKKKLAKGRTKVEAFVVQPDTGARYNIHDFPEYVEPKTSTGKPSGNNAKRPRRDLPEWVLRLIEHGNDAEGEHAYGGDRSRAQWAVLLQLRRHGWDEGEAVEVILKRENRISEHTYAQGNPRRYAEKQVRKAFAVVDDEPQRPEAPSGATAAPLVMIDPREWEGEPVLDRRWVVPDWIPEGYVTGLYGNGGLGKSLVAQQLATCVATGKRWLGMDVQKTRCIYFGCEDLAEELHRRQAAINRLCECRFSDLEALRLIERLGHDNILMQFDRYGRPAMTPLVEGIIEKAQEHGATLIVLDTVSDFFSGNENDRSQVRHFVQGCLGYIARRIGGTVLAVAHPSRAGMQTGEGDSGSTGWSNAFRSRLYLSDPTKEKNRIPDPDVRVLSRRKGNYARRMHDEIRLRWTDGAFRLADDYEKRPPVDEVFLNLLDQLTKEKRPVSQNSRASNYAPKVFVQTPDSHDYRVVDFELAMTILLRNRAIQVVPYGRPSKRSERLERVGAMFTGDGWEEQA